MSEEEQIRSCITLSWRQGKKGSYRFVLAPTVVSGDEDPCNVKHGMKSRWPLPWQMTAMTRTLASKAVLSDGIIASDVF